MTATFIPADPNVVAEAAVAAVEATEESNVGLYCLTVIAIAAIASGTFLGVAATVVWAIAASCVTAIAGVLVPRLR